MLSQSCCRLPSSWASTDRAACRFECIGDGTNNTINNVTLEPTKYDRDEQSSAYDGPVSSPRGLANQGWL